MLKRIKSTLKANFVKLSFGATTTGALLLNSIPAHAADTDISGITSQITTSLSSSKTEFVTALGSVVVVAVGFFIVKFVVKQVISYFAKIASK